LKTQVLSYFFASKEKLIFTIYDEGLNLEENNIYWKDLWVTAN
jgi:hypothetical protein